MACSCRMIALRIFARSLAQIHAPTTQYARPTWPSNRTRLPNRNISIAHNYRQAHTLAESSDTAAEGQEAQNLLPEDQCKPQPGENSQPSSSRAFESAGEEDRLFTITTRSKNAIRKLARYSLQSGSSLSSESQGHPEEKPDKDQQPRTSTEELERSTEELKTSTEEPKTSTEESTEQPKKIKTLREKKRQQRAEKRAERSEQQASKAKDKEESDDNSPEEFKTSAEESTEQPKKINKLREKKRQKRAEELTERSQHQAARAKDKKERHDNRPMWLKQKEALKEKFPEGWRPPKRLSPDALEGIRVLHRQFPDMYTTAALAEKFEVSPEAIRRILKSKWEPNAEEDESRQKRWFNRGVSVWQRYAELGLRPPRRWLEAGVQAGPGEPSPKEQQPEKEDVAGDIDPETAIRLQAQMKLSKSLV